MAKMARCWLVQQFLIYRRLSQDSERLPTGGRSVVIADRSRQLPCHWICHLIRFSTFSLEILNFFCPSSVCVSCSISFLSRLSLSYFSLVGLQVISA